MGALAIGHRHRPSVDTRFPCGAWGHFNLPETDDVVFCGGPVEPSALVILHDDSDFEDDGRLRYCPVFSSGAVLMHLNALSGEAAASGSMKHCFRVLSGYSGWGSRTIGRRNRQRRLVDPSRLSRIGGFYDDPYTIYDVLLQRFYEANHILPHRVKDPSAN